jgi:hypothetical protein
MVSEWREHIDFIMKNIITHHNKRLHIMTKGMYRYTDLLILALIVESLKTF